MFWHMYRPLKPSPHSRQWIYLLASKVSSCPFVLSTYPQATTGCLLPESSLCYVKENHTVCIVSLCIILIFFQLMNSIPICRCTTVSSIHYLLKQIWAVSSFLLSQNKAAVNNHVFIDLYKDCAFISPVYIPRNGMTRSYGRCMFNLLINCQAVCQSLYFPNWFTFSAVVGISVPLYPCQHLVCVQSF